MDIRNQASNASSLLDSPAALRRLADRHGGNLFLWGYLESPLILRVQSARRPLPALSTSRRSPLNAASLPRQRLAASVRSRDASSAGVRCACPKAVCASSSEIPKKSATSEYSHSSILLVAYWMLR